MKRYSKEKKQQLVLVVMLSVMAVAGLWFGLIKYQKESLQALSKRQDEAERKLAQVKQAIANAEQYELQVSMATKTASQLEAGMASGDLYSWAINTIRQFKLPYKVEIPQFSQIDGPKESTLLAGFPYKQATLTIGGTAEYQDFGRFVADFENHFKYMRVLNVTLEPAPTQKPDEREKLAFKMDIAALVKPGA